MLHYIIGITILTLGIIIIRAFSNGKVLHKHQYAFWIVIPIYMILMPFINIDVSVADIWNTMFAPKTDTVTYEVVDNDSPVVKIEDIQTEQVISDDLSVEEPETQKSPELINEHEQITNNYVVSNIKTNKTRRIESVLVKSSYCVSAVLIVALIVYNIGFILHCKRQRNYIFRDPSSGLKIYSIQQKGTPFLLFNKIYIDNDSKINEYVICHEACHYKHGDYLWVLIRYLVLFLNWYNPIIWIAFIISGRDCEYACDEEVLKVYGVDSSKDYARTLVGIPQQQSNTAVFSLSTGMRGGYTTMKKRIVNIKKPAKLSRKAAALSMAGILLVTSCSFVNTSNNARKIKADDPWFNTQIINVDTGADEGRNVDYSQFSLKGSNEQYYVIYTIGRYQTKPNEGLDYFTYISVVDKTTKQTVASFDPTVGFSNYDHVDDVYLSDGKITVKVSGENNEERDYDPSTGVLLETRPLSSKNNEMLTSSDKYFIGEYEIETVGYYMENTPTTYDIQIKAPDGKVTTTEFKEPGKDIHIQAFLAISDTEVLIPVSVNGGKNELFELNLKSGELTPLNADDYEWMNKNLRTAVQGSDGMMYFLTGYGISRINARLKTSEEAFNFSWSELNGGFMNEFEIVECSNDRFVLLGQYDSGSVYSGETADKVEIVELTRADKNPNAGKTVLELYAQQGVGNGIDRYTGDAIISFNQTNKKFFIEIASRYDLNEFYDDSDVNVNNEDTMKMAQVRAQASMSNKLAVDIMNGDGPDILINTSAYGQLNRSEYLVDLSPYVKDFSSDDYFTNIIEGARINGAIYQIPVSYSVEGILTNAKYAGSSGKGFTLEEYAQFVDEVANGKDPIMYGQAMYFSMLFNNMSEEFVNNGKVDLSNPKFAELAKYVKDNVNEKGSSLNGSTSLEMPAYCTGCYGMGGFWQRVYQVEHTDSNMTMLGYPSVDGGGPTYSPSCSVAVSAQATDVKACGEFIKILLSDEVQTRIAMDDNFVLNRKAFIDAGVAGIEYYNHGGSGCDGGLAFGVELVFGKEYTMQNVYDVEKFILNCSRMRSEDADIRIILIEEMPPYFLGQKDLDAVIKIAQDRIQKVLNERG